MFTRSSNVSAPEQQGSRRAFNDVTNAKRSNASGKNVVVTKRSNGIKTRAMSVGSSNPSRPVYKTSFDPTPTLLEKKNPGAATSNDYFKPNLQPVADSYQLTGNTDDIDERDMNDPLCCTAYVHEMYENYRKNELISSVRPNYMTCQTHINERMRAILVDWLIEVHLKFKLVPETLYLTITLIDRFLEREEVERSKLQLVGVACLLLASKHEEIYPPELRDLVYICDRAYTRQDILEMEVMILKTLNYSIPNETSHVFLVRFLKAGHADKRIVQLSCYLLDATLQSYRLLHYLPSQLAAAVVYLARRSVGRNGWSPTLLKYAGYCEEEIQPVARAILEEKNNANPELKAVAKKFSSHRFGQVATTTTLSVDF